MVIPRGASDDVCSDTKNQALPPRGDKSHERHERAEDADCKLNFASVSAEGKDHPGQTIKTASTARHLPPCQIDNSAENSIATSSTPYSSVLSKYAAAETSGLGAQQTLGVTQEALPAPANSSDLSATSQTSVLVPGFYSAVLNQHADAPGTSGSDSAAFALHRVDTIQKTLPSVAAFRELLAPTSLSLSLSSSSAAADSSPAPRTVAYSPLVQRYADAPLPPLLPAQVDVTAANLQVRVGGSTAETSVAATTVVTAAADSAAFSLHHADSVQKTLPSPATFKDALGQPVDALPATPTAAYSPLVQKYVDAPLALPQHAQVEPALPTSSVRVVSGSVEAPVAASSLSSVGDDNGAFLLHTADSLQKTLVSTATLKDTGASATDLPPAPVKVAYSPLVQRYADAPLPVPTSVDVAAPISTVRVATVAADATIAANTPIPAANDGALFASHVDNSLQKTLVSTATLKDTVAPSTDLPPAPVKVAYSPLVQRYADAPLPVPTPVDVAAPISTVRVATVAADATVATNTPIPAANDGALFASHVDNSHQISLASAIALKETVAPAADLPPAPVKVAYSPLVQRYAEAPPPVPTQVDVVAAPSPVRVTTGAADATIAANTPILAANDGAIFATHVDNSHQISLPSAIALKETVVPATDLPPAPVKVAYSPLVQRYADAPPVPAQVDVAALPSPVRIAVGAADATIATTTPVSAANDSATFATNVDNSHQISLASVTALKEKLAQQADESAKAKVANSSIVQRYADAQLPLPAQVDVAAAPSSVRIATVAADATIAATTPVLAANDSATFATNVDNSHQISLASVTALKEKLAQQADESAKAKVSNSSIVQKYADAQLPLPAQVDVPVAPSPVRVATGAADATIAANTPVSAAFDSATFATHGDNSLQKTLVSTATLKDTQTPVEQTNSVATAYSPVIQKYADTQYSPVAFALNSSDSTQKAFPDPVQLAVGFPVQAFDSNGRKVDVTLSPILASFAAPLNSVDIGSRPFEKQPNQIIAGATPADQNNQIKNLPNVVRDATQFNGIYVGPGSTTASVDQSSQVIPAARRIGSSLARDAVEQGQSSNNDNGVKQFFALPNSVTSAKPFTIDGQTNSTVKVTDTTTGTIAAESLKQLLGRNGISEQTVAALAADALKIIISRQLTSEHSTETTIAKPATSAIEYKASTSIQTAIGVGSELTQVTHRSINNLTSNEATVSGSVIQSGIKVGTASDIITSQPINTIIGIGTITAIGLDGKPIIADGKASLIDGRLIGTLSPLPAELTGTIKNADGTTVPIGKDTKLTNLTETVGTRKGETTKLGDIVSGTLDSSLPLTNKTGDKKGQIEEDDEEKVKNVGTMAGAGGFGGGASDPDKDPKNNQNSQSTVTGTVVDPDQKMVLPDLEIVDEHALPPGTKIVSVATHVEIENGIANADPKSRQDDLIEIGAKTDANNSNYGTELSEIDRLFGITKNQQTDDQTAWQAGQQAEFLSFERRRVYKLKRGETLADVARRELGNVDFVHLIVEINIDTLTFNRYGQIILKAGQEIHLPSRADMLRFVAYQQHQDKVLLAFVDEKGIDTSTQIVYACRLGDTLASVAKRHPAVRDARLWKLIAELNDLSTKQDKNGSPVARLQRGQHLLLPTSEQKSDYIHELAFGTKSKDLSGDFVRHIPRENSVQPAPSAPVKPITEDTREVIADLQMVFPSRLISQSDLGDTGDSLNLRLELQVDGQFVPVVEYIIGFGTATLHVRTKSGESKTTNIDLPNRSARELAESDLAANASKYCHNFENNLLPF